MWNDTLFLSSINVMDYSLLVGMEQRAPAEVAEGLGVRLGLGPRPGVRVRVRVWGFGSGFGG